MGRVALTGAIGPVGHMGGALLRLGGSGMWFAPEVGAKKCSAKDKITEDDKYSHRDCQLCQMWHGPTKVQV